jgi:DNA-directed RNA polymerase II subunit RPB1
MSINPTYYSEDIKKIEKIEFSIYRNKDVKLYSAVSSDPFGIDLAESYENYEPKKGGLVDLRLGPCDILLPCTTCGQTSNDCPGHFGHTELAEPVFHFGFINHLKNILQCICLKCSNLLIEKSDSIFKKSLAKKPEARFKEIKAYTKNTNFCYSCGVAVSKIKRDTKDSGSVKIMIERDIVGEVNKEDPNAIKKTKESLSPRDCYNILRNISDDDCRLLGFNVKMQRPEDMIITIFPIPPVAIRPTARIDFMTSATMENSLTLKISDIITSNKRVRQQMEKETIANELSTYNQDIFNLLQYNVATYFDNESTSMPRTEFKTGGRAIKSISDRIKGKAGRVRSNLMGKRVDFSARSVITSDPYIDIDMVGIPKKIAMELTIPEEVTPYNIKYLTGLVKNGRDNYPGANFVLRVNFRDGKQEVQKIDLKYRKKSIRLNYGDIVERHSVDGDYVLFNRQPTLHKPSMMGHKIQVIDNDELNTFRMSVSVCKPYNADFDGDEMNIHLAQSIQARNELKLIANVQYQIVSAKDSSPIIGCQQDTLSGAYLLTEPSVRLKGWEVANILCNTTSDTKMSIDMNKEYTGHEVFSFIIPEGINMNDGIVIKNGKLISGHLNKAALSFAKNSIIHFIWDKYGPSKTRRFIDDAQRLVLNYLLLRGETMGFGDCMIDDKMFNQIEQYMNNKILESKYNITQYENDTDQLSLTTIENGLSQDINTVGAEVGQMLMSHLNNDNFLWAAAKSGAKGDATNVAKVNGCFGQNNVEGVRIKKKIEGRSLMYFHKDDDTPEARGFIKNSFMTGLRGFEFFFNTMAGREGLIDTAIKTAQTGYIQRQLIKGLEDLSIRYDGTNRNSRGIIIQTVYGENGINQSTQTSLLLDILNMDNKTLKAKLCFSSEQLKKMAGTKSLKLSAKELDDFNNKHTTKLMELRDEMRDIQRRALLNYKIMEEKYVSPVNLYRITQFYSNKKEHIELDPQYVVDKIEEFLNNYDNRLITAMKPTDKYMKADDRRLKFLLEVALNEYLAPAKCIFEYGLSKEQFNKMMEEIRMSFIKSIIEPGEMVGIIAAQSVGEPTSQMSVIQSTKLKLVVKNKETRTISFYSDEIGMLCDKLINMNPDTTYNTGHVNSVETDLVNSDEYYIVGVDEKETTHWNKISHVSRHPVNGMLMTVTTKSGRSVTTTMSHSHLIRKNQTVEPITGSDLKVGMRIPSARHIDNTFVVDTIKIGNMEYKLDNLFGWFVGAYLAEGSISNTSISISNISEHYIKNTKEFAKRFNKMAKDRHRMGEYGPSVSTIFSCKVLADYMVQTMGNGSFVKRVPDFAFTAPNEFKAGLLQGYFDGDGNFQSQIRACSRSEQLIKDIALLLNYFDIFGSIKKQNVKGMPMYNLAMSARYSILYKQHIDSVLHKDKLNDMVEYAEREDAHNLSDEIDKINGLGEVIAKCGKVLGMEGQSRTYGRGLKKESIGRRTLQKYIGEFKAHTKANMIQRELAILKQAADSSVIWDEIVDIKVYTPDQTEYVYDFTVPGNQTFMVDSGVIVHNTLNTKHFAGAAGKSTKNKGLSRIQELVHFSKNIKSPTMTIYFKDNYVTDKSALNKLVSYFKHLSIRQLIASAEVYYDLGLNDTMGKLIKADNVASPFYVNNMKSDISSLPFVFRIKMDIEKMLDKETTLLDIKTKFISHWYKNYTNLKNLKKNEKEVISRISRCAILSNSPTDKEQVIHIRFSMSSFNYNIITEFLRMVFDDITLKGIENIDDIELTQERCINIDKGTGEIKVEKEPMIETDGINIEKMRMMKGIDFTRTKCNDIATILRLYGIEATRQVLINELITTYESKINHNHLSLLVDQMCHLGEITSIDRHGMSKIDMDPIARASFEKTMDHFINAAMFNEKDTMKSVSSRIAIGRVINGGTGSFDLMLDTKKLENSEYTEDETGGRVTYIPLEEEPLLHDIMTNMMGKNKFFVPK